MMKLLSCPSLPLPATVSLRYHTECFMPQNCWFFAVGYCACAWLFVLVVVVAVFLGCFLHGGQHVSRGLFWPLPYIFRVVTGTYAAPSLSLALSQSLPLLLSLSHKANNRVVNHFLISGLRR